MRGSLLIPVTLSEFRQVGIWNHPVTVVTSTFVCIFVVECSTVTFRTFHCYYLKLLDTDVGDCGNVHIHCIGMCHISVLAVRVHSFHIACTLSLYQTFHGLKIKLFGLWGLIATVTISQFSSVLPQLSQTVIVRSFSTVS